MSSDLNMRLKGAEMRMPGIISLFLTLLFFTGLSAETSDWNLVREKHGTAVKTTGTATIGEVHVQSALDLYCNESAAGFNFKIADYEKLQKVFDIRTFEGPSAPTRSLALTTIELEGVNPVQSMNVRQNGFISVDNKFVFEIRDSALAQFYKHMASERTLLRIRIKSYHNPKQFIIAEFPQRGSQQAMAGLKAACIALKSQTQKPAKNK
jgi:hypothetical protein